MNQWLKRVVPILTAVGLLLTGCSSSGFDDTSSAPIERAPLTIAVQRQLEEPCREGIRQFAERLSILGEGEFDLSIIYVDDPYQSMQEGEADLLYLDGELLSSHVPEFSIYTSPFYFRDYQTTTMSLNSPNFHDLTEEDYRQDLGLRQLTTVWAGSSVLVATEYLSDLSSLDNITIAIEGDKYQSYVFSGFGARVTQMARADRYEQFSDGAFTAVECRTEDLTTLKLKDPRNTYLSETFHRGRLEWCFVTQDCYERLTERQRAALEEAAAVLVSTLEQARQEEYANQRESLEMDGVEVVRLQRDSIAKRARDLLFSDPEFNAATNWNRYDTVLAFIR